MENLIMKMVNTKLNTDLYKNRKSRKREHVEARSLYFKLMRDLTNMSLSSIAKTLEKDHALVIHAIKSYETYSIYEEYLPKAYDYIVQEVPYDSVSVKDESIKIKYREAIDKLEKATLRTVELEQENANLKAIASTKDSSIDADLLEAVKMIPESQLINAIPRITAMAKMMQSAKYN